MTKILTKQENYNNKLMLFDAVENNNIEQVTKMINQGINLNIVNSEDKTPLDVAIKNNYWEIIKLLVNNNGKVYCNCLSNKYENVC
jgi:ankyrin repeat protein